MTRTSRGFTLLETMVALTLTALVLGIAGTALATAGDARGRIAAHARTAEADARLRAALTDMLRHAPDADAVDEPLLRVVRTEDGATSLVFLSRGVVQPLGTGPIWRVTLGMNGVRGLRLVAEPIGARAGGATLQMALPQATSLDLAVLERAGDGGAWRFDWPVERARPALVRIAWDSASAPLIVPLDAPGTAAEWAP